MNTARSLIFGSLCMCVCVCGGGGGRGLGGGAFKNYAFLCFKCAAIDVRYS